MKRVSPVVSRSKGISYIVGVFAVCFLLSSCEGGGDSGIIDPNLLGQTLKLEYRITYKNAAGNIVDGYDQTYKGTLYYQQLWNFNKTVLDYTNQALLIPQQMESNLQDTVNLIISGVKDFTSAADKETFSVRHYLGLSSFDVQNPIHNEHTTGEHSASSLVITNDSRLIGKENLTIGDTVLSCDKFLVVGVTKKVENSTQTVLNEQVDSVYYWFSPDRFLFCRSEDKYEERTDGVVKYRSYVTEALTSFKRS